MFGPAFSMRNETKVTSHFADRVTFCETANRAHNLRGSHSGSALSQFFERVISDGSNNLTHSGNISCPGLPR